MELFDDYKIIEELHKGTSFVTLRAFCNETGRRVILKTSSSQWPNPVENIHLQHEYGLLKSLEMVSSKHPLCLKQHGSRNYLVFDDFKDQRLSEYLKKEIISIAFFLKVAMSLTQIISELHHKNIILKNLHPDYILFDEDSCQLLLLNIDLLSDPKHLHIKENSYYNYISPEQTGRMNGSIDKRTDYYSLGVIFYQLLTQCLPFIDNDPLALVHAHIAKTPDDPATLRGDIPTYVSRLILKLLEKSPARRHQHCSEILEELQNCEKLYSGNESMLNYTQKKRFTAPVLISTKLYNREHELAQLTSYFQEDKLRGNEMILISGPSGVGKTKLVEEIQKRSVLDHSFFASAKFDVHKTNIPYSALIVAFRSLIQKILTFEQSVLDYWKNRLNIRLGGHMALIATVIPELLLISEDQNTPQELPPDESQNRFNHTITSFISALADQAHPLVLFLDDLQWADSASLTQLEHILLDDSIQGLLFIGTYRDTEFTELSALYHTIQKVLQKRSALQIKLSSLDLDALRTMLSEHLELAPEEATSLANLFYAKTLGNPFFANQFLWALSNESYLNFDAQTQKWVWNETQISKLQISDNVVDFIIAKLQDFDFATLEVLKAASCIGDEFGIEILSHVAGFSPYVTYLQLEIAIQQQLICPVDNSSNQAVDNTKGDLFRFSHDRVRQAIYSILLETEKEMIKMKTGYYLLRHLETENVVSDIVFTVADHLNFAETLITGVDKVEQLIQLNYQAGIKAKNSNAYDAAIGYFAMGKKHLNFRDHYSELFKFYLQSAECEYLNGDYKSSENNLNEVLRFAKTKLDKLAIYKIKCHLYTSMDDKVKAVKAGIEGLRQLNIYIPTQKMAVMASVVTELILARLHLPKGKIDMVLDKPILQKEEKVKVMELMLTLAPPAYQYDQNVFALLVLKMLNISLKHGNTGVSSHGLLGYGMILSSLSGDYATGKKLAEVALKLNDKLKYTSIKWKLLLAYHNFVIHWTEGIRNSLHSLLEIEHGAIKDGDPIYAGYAIGTRLLKMFVLGFPLTDVKGEFEKYDQILEKRGDRETKHIVEPCFHVIRFLCGEEKRSLKLPDFFRNDDFVRDAKQHSSFTVIAEYYIAKMMLCYLVGDFEEGKKALESGKAYILYVNTRYEICMYHFYAALLLIKDMEVKPHGYFSTKKRAVNSHLKKLEQWALFCPENFQALYLIVMAENRKIEKDFANAPQLYEKAIENAAKYGFSNYLALAYELAGKYYQAQKLEKIAHIYLCKAKETYAQWGAQVKVSQLDATYKPNELATTGQSARQLFPDTAYLMKAAAAISYEGDIDSLFERLIKIVMENACADKGLFLMNHQGRLFIKAWYDISTNKVILADGPLDNEMAPITLLRYVERTKTTVVINPELSANTYDQDTYFKNHSPRSILCFPILEKMQLQGIFYLENSLSENVFTQSHLDSLSLLSGQISVSLSNAEMKRAQEDHMLDLQKATIETQEKEKRRIAQDLHDEIGVNLSAIRLLVKQLKRKLDLVPEYTTTAQLITEAIDATIGTTRRIAHDLMPSSLEKLGLIESLEGLCQELNDISEIEIVYKNTCGRKPLLEKMIQVQVYRIVKEILNNSIKHANARQIELALAQKEGCLIVKIKDNGIGFSLENSREQGMGIKSIENRCCLIQAKLQIRSKVDYGTEITFALNVADWQSSVSENSNNYVLN